jgi:ABC-type nitrate/sulfonate/bicarbonate transport system ATPase subunit
MSKTLEVRGLNKVSQGPGRSLEALRDLTFAVDASELVCVVGPSPDMAVVYQEYGRSLFAWMTIRANVELPLRAKGMARDRREELTGERDQLTTRSDPRLTQLRSHVHGQIQQAKRSGHPGQLTAGR